MDFKKHLKILMGFAVFLLLVSLLLSIFPQRASADNYYVPSNKNTTQGAYLYCHEKNINGNVVNVCRKTDGKDYVQ